MDSNQALIVLIDRLNTSDKPVCFGWDELQQWQEGVLDAFVAVGLLVKDVNARSLQCTGCEHHCFMAVVLTDDKSGRAFIVCDHPDMQSQMGRINVSPTRLQQWQSSQKYLAVVVAGLLGFEALPDYQKNSSSFKLGMLKGKNGRYWAMLQTQPLMLEVNRHVTPIIDQLYFDGGVLVIDESQINVLVNTVPNDTGKTYIPNVDKQEARKLATQIMYQDWNDEYLRLKCKHPDKSATWCSVQIEKMTIAQGKDSETIRKNMKK